MAELKGGRWTQLRKLWRCDGCCQERLPGRAYVYDPQHPKEQARLAYCVLCQREGRTDPVPDPDEEER
jgi:hypothetical protein